MRRRPSARNGNWPAAVTASTGRKSTKTSAPKGSFAGRQRRGALAPRNEAVDRVSNRSRSIIYCGMHCPFPGMDPYLERPEIWPDFHDSLITYLKETLQPMLRPRYAAMSEHRLYVIESEHPIRPDVSVVRSRRGAAGDEGRATAAKRAI